MDSNIIYRTKKSLFKVESWFLPHVKRWLIKSNESTFDWVENAVAQDQVRKNKYQFFHAEGNELSQS